MSVGRGWHLLVKLAAAVTGLASAGVATAITINPHTERVGPGSGTLLAASPADRFVVHDGPMPVTPVPPPAAPDPPAPDALEAAIERLRQAAPKPDATPPSPAPAIDPLLAGPNPATSILAGPPLPPPQLWTNVTSQGARWRTNRDAAGPMLVLDMGGGRVATVQVDPAFQTLPPEGANARVDFIKQTILETFPRGSAQFRFTRDGSVSLLR